MIEFLSQGGYAFYVWSCFGMGLILMAAEVVSLRNKHRTIVARLRRIVRMQKVEVEDES